MSDTFKVSDTLNLSKHFRYNLRTIVIYFFALTQKSNKKSQERKDISTGCCAQHFSSAFRCSSPANKKIVCEEHQRQRKFLSLHRVVKALAVLSQFLFLFVMVLPFFAFSQNLNNASLSSKNCFSLSAGDLDNHIFN